MIRGPYIKGFTLLELVITMVITSLLVTIIVATTSNLFSYHTRLSQNIEDKLMLKSLKYRLNSDLVNSGVWQSENSQIKFVTSVDSITYSFSNAKVLRKQGVRSDSFNLSGFRHTTQYPRLG